MTKYFYSDPLAAAWMARQFGMKFHPGTEPIKSIQRLPYGPSRFNIHPDSLHLLEPQHGDIISPSSSMMGIYIIGQNAMCDRNMNAVPHTGYMDMETVKSIQSGWGKNTILQRNNIPFMWPESEE